MNLRLKHLVPIVLLCGPGCIDVPEVEPLPETPLEKPDGGNPGQAERGSFKLSAAPGRVSVLQGKSQVVQLSLERERGFGEGVLVSAVNPPAGVTVQPVTLAAGSTSASLDVEVAQGAEPGVKVLALRGTAGTLVHETTVELTVVKLGDLLVAWASPVPDAVPVNGALALRVTVAGGEADYVEVLRDQTVLQRLPGPSYEYTWDTTQSAEQTYSLTARAVRGGSTFTSVAKTVVVDRTAPSVAGRAPASGAANVSVHDAIRVTFSEAMKPGSVTDAAVTVTAGGTSLEKTLALSSDGKVLTVKPSALLPVQATVTVTLGAVTDLAGNELTAAAPWTFTVPTWLPMGGAISALPGSTAAENVALKLGADGNPVIAWSEFDGATSAKYVYVRHWTGGQWEPIGDALSGVNGSDTNAVQPSLAVDSANRPIVVWEESSGTVTNLYGRAWNGVGWDVLPPFPAISQAGGGRGRPSVVKTANGDVMVSASYYDGSTNNMEVFAWKKGSGGWGTIFTRPSNIGSPSFPYVIEGADGRPLMVYSGFAEAGRGLLVQKYQDTVNWSSVGGILYSRNQMSLWGATLAIDGEGNPVVAWSETTYQNDELSAGSVYAARWNGSSWVVLGGQLASAATKSDEAFVSRGADGQPWVAWSAIASMERSIWVARWDGSSWQSVGSPLSAVSGGTTAAFKPVLALDKNGQPLVAWHESDGSTSNIYVYRYNY
ncbi:Ig-like domain-containing protein [Myxococcaceae bacterium GXIMD 01537]